MAIVYPASADSLSNPSSGDAPNSPSHSQQHSDANDAIEALEAKLGTGASTPVANRIMYGNGTGTSAWTQLTSAQLAASVSDETGSGSVVFANTPTLVTPKMDTINENTSANGVTVDGLNIKDGALTTSNSVVTANITANAVTTAKLATGSNFTPRTAEQNPYKFAAYKSGTQSPSATTWTKVTCDTEEYDTGSNYDNATNYRFTAPVAGFYQFSGGVSAGAGVSGVLFMCALYKNGTEFKRGVQVSGNGTQTNTIVSPPPFSLAINDYIELYVFGGAGFTTTAGQNNVYFGGYLVSAT